MTALHSALQALAPCNFTADIPSSPAELEAYVSDLFSKSQLILESIPIQPPEENSSSAHPRSHTGHASNASEVISSSARSAVANPEYVALQKEWGKPIKLSAKENPMGMSVYKVSGKDSRGAWFARRSVLEGLGFSRFKKALESEFPESMAVQGGPGEGNVRGIGGEKKVEDIQVGGKGRIEVYQLSAQFPGPTTPRDFITFLVTSTNAMNESKDSEPAPRHYMIISKPCIHPECPQRDGFIRGQYESVEFIREVPLKHSKAASHSDPSHATGGRDPVSLEQEVLLRNAGKRSYTFPIEHENKSANDVSDRKHLPVVGKVGQSRDTSPSGRKRGATYSFSEHKADAMEGEEHPISSSEDYSSETNPVEWIMITRSDPGGSVPRFMVERGTPGSIVADASKFLNWATQKTYPAGGDGGVPAAAPHSQTSHANGLATETHELPHHEKSHHHHPHHHKLQHEMTAPEPSSHEKLTHEISTQSLPPVLTDRSPPISPQEPPSHSSLFTSVSGALSSTLHTYAPKAILDHLPGSSPMSPTTPTVAAAAAEPVPVPAPRIENSSHEQSEDDSSSIMSSSSFASADSHMGDGDMSPSISSKSSPDNNTKEKDRQLTQHDKELAKIAARRKQLDEKLAVARDKHQKDTETQTAKDKEAIKKAEERHERDMKKQEEKHKREIAKLEQRKEKEAKKLEDKRKKLKDKDEKSKLTRERDEARSEIEVLKKELEIFKKQVGELQKENTKFIARIGKLESGGEGVAGNDLVKNLLDEEVGSGGSATPGSSGEAIAGTSRSSSLRKAARASEEDKGVGVGVAGAGVSVVH